MKYRIKINYVNSCGTPNYVAQFRYTFLPVWFRCFGWEGSSSFIRAEGVIDLHKQRKKALT